MDRNGRVKLERKLIQRLFRFAYAIRIAVRVSLFRANFQQALNFANAKARV